MAALLRSGWQPSHGTGGNLQRFTQSNFGKRHEAAQIPYRQAACAQCCKARTSEKKSALLWISGSGHTSFGGACRRICRWP
ncbi:MAG: hypothetical protein F4158_05040 [Synechococcus sp. SB0675_bin_7]|nr:hypothetical protein [Synechococcus sp. SB0675_bin_7]